jgi:hypothetical protein
LNYTCLTGTLRKCLPGALVDHIGSTGRSGMSAIRDADKKPIDQMKEFQPFERSIV